MKSLLLALGLIVFLPCQVLAADIYLVRHAEKQLDVKDPELTAQGQQRALALAELLRQKPVERIMSSDYRRTRQTAAPLAEQLGQTVEIYNAKDLQALANTLRERAVTTVVVGHSNTTPELALLLGAPDFGEIEEKSEYDRLYVIPLDNPQQAELLRFGAGH
ncbi:SixA phosphatase family protein [Paraferrimonas sedimenticola]|uniref:Phosphoglycerate mutase n=1 Tax=Paraferrimonas sedimenticola TaxID=375674 RepID=A0AA37RWP2_9GAMM|nr:phosphoglycerate mutase family protein [Paraferrimonas sedimenticola]GLP97100.1 phosphoglycerate mutase [Paraferrimonas sedimenticola]